MRSSRPPNDNPYQNYLTSWDKPLQIPQGAMVIIVNLNLIEVAREKIILGKESKKTLKSLKLLQSGLRE